MANIKHEISADAIVKMIFQGLVVAVIISFILGYMLGRQHESIVNLNELTYHKEEVV